MGRKGGRKRNVEKRGKQRIRERNAQFNINQGARDRGMRVKNRECGEDELEAEAEKVLREEREGMSSFMINRAES